MLCCCVVLVGLLHCHIVYSLFPVYPPIFVEGVKETAKLLLLFGFSKEPKTRHPLFPYARLCPSPLLSTYHLPTRKWKGQNDGKRPSRWRPIINIPFLISCRRGWLLFLTPPTTTEIPPIIRVQMPPASVRHMHWIPDDLYRYAKIF